MLLHLPQRTLHNGLCSGDHDIYKRTTDRMNDYCYNKEYPGIQCTLSQSGAITDVGIDFASSLSNKHLPEKSAQSAKAYSKMPEISRRSSSQIPTTHV